MLSYYYNCTYKSAVFESVTIEQTCSTNPIFHQSHIPQCTMCACVCIFLLRDGALWDICRNALWDSWDRSIVIRFLSGLWERQLMFAIFLRWNHTCVCSIMVKECTPGKIAVPKLRIKGMFFGSWTKTWKSRPDKLYLRYDLSFL